MTKPHCRTCHCPETGTIPTSAKCWILYFADGWSIERIAVYLRLLPHSVENRIVEVVADINHQADRLNDLLRVLGAQRGPLPDRK